MIPRKHGEVLLFRYLVYVSSLILTLVFQISEVFCTSKNYIGCTQKVNVCFDKWILRTSSMKCQPIRSFKPGNKSGFQDDCLTSIISSDQTSYQIITSEDKLFVEVVQIIIYRLIVAPFMPLLRFPETGWCFKSSLTADDLSAIPLKRWFTCDDKMTKMILLSELFFRNAFVEANLGCHIGMFMK